MKATNNWLKYVWVLGAALGGLLVAVLISQIWLNPSFPVLTGLFKTAANEISNKQKSNGSSEATTENSTEKEPKDAASNVLDSDVEELTKIENYVRQESKSLDMAQAPSREKQIESAAMARQLTEAQSDQLILILEDTERPVNERIFSAYILSLSPADFASADLNDFASTELPNFGPKTPHSEAEIRSNQELALRFMAIDRMAELARDPTISKLQRDGAMNNLRLQAAKNPAEQIRKYAQSTLDELSKLSP